MSRLDVLVERGLLSRDVPIGRLTTYKLGGACRFFAEVGDIGQLTVISEAARADRLPVLVIGRGSNLLVSDGGFDGLVIHLRDAFTKVEVNGSVVVAGGAVSLALLARRAAKAGRGGLEWCVGVPGSVGGAVAMNAGCFGTETSDVLDRATIFDLSSGLTTATTNAELAMGYRTTALRSSDVVLEATFRTTETETVEAERTMREITRWRRDNQPGGTLNAGSVFKNPNGDSAGRIIEAAGLKGRRSGDVSVSPRHANFFVAGPTARAQDVYDLVKIVQGEVLEETGLQLEPELRMVGSFDSFGEDSAK